MERDNSAVSPDKASFEVNLASTEISAGVIGIMGYLMLIVSAKQDIAEITGSQSEAAASAEPSPAPQTAVLASLLITTANTLIAEVAVKRLRELKKEQQEGTETASIEPNINIANGSVLSALGNAIESVGTLQRASMPEARITIL